MRERRAKKRVERSAPPPVPVLSSRVGDLSSRRREIIRPVIENPRDFVLLSIRDLAARLSTDPATIVRIVRGMGFENFKAFKQDLHELSLAQVTSFDSLQSAMAHESTVAAQSRASIENDLKNLQALRRALDFERLEATCKRIIRASGILLIGGDLAETLVSYLEYQMALIDLPVVAATTTGRIIHRTRTVTSKHVVIAVSFGRGLRQTVEGMLAAQENGAHCIGITDTYLSPLARYADEFYLTSVCEPSFGASYVAPLAFLNALLLCCGALQPDHSLEVLRRAGEEQTSGYRWYQDPKDRPPFKP